jgi:putative PEP-CTERM system TPR-repeat lipoprotein
MRPCERRGNDRRISDSDGAHYSKETIRAVSRAAIRCLERSVVLNLFRTIALLLGLVALAACTRTDPAAELAAARENIAARQYVEAAIRLSNVVQVQPDNGDARRMRGELFLLNGEYSSAAEELDRARTLGNEADTLAVSLADAWTATGRHDEALSLLDSVAQAHVSDATYWVVRAEALLRAGRVAEAERALESGEQAGDIGVRGQIARAGAAFARDDVAGAEEIFRRLLEASPNDPSVLMARANLLARSGRLSDAAADLTRAAASYRADSLLTRELTALVSLAQIQLAVNDLDAAEATAAQLVERAPQAPLTAYFQGLVEYRRGRFDQAADIIQPLVSASPDTPQFRSALGAIHLARGELGQAEQQFLAVLANSPRDPAAVKLLAETRLRQQRPEAALSALRSVEAAAAEDPQIGLLSGVANLLTGNTEQGVLYLQQAAALDPTNELLKLQLARAYLAAGRSADASALLQGAFSAGTAGLEAAMLRLLAAIPQGGDGAGDAAAQDLLASFPDEPRALTAAAMYFQLRGDSARARELFERAAARETDGAVARMFVAAALVQDGRREDAEQLLRRVVEQQPENGQALNALAELALARGALDEGAELLTRAADHSDTVLPRLALVQLRLRQGDLAAAKEQLERAATAAPGSPEVGAVSGVIALAEGRPQDAVALLAKAETALPNRLGVTLALARAQIASGKPDDARTTVQRVLAAAPRSLPLRLMLGEAELRLGNAEEASSIAAQLKADYPAQSGGYILEADAQIATRRYNAAADTLATAFERESTWPVLTRLLEARQLAGQSAEAMSAIQQWVAANPQHVPGKLMQAGLLQSADRDAEALGAYQAVIAIDDSNLAALNNAAWLANELNRPGALDLAEKAHALARDNPAVLDTLGWILVGQKRGSEAIPHLSRAAELAPNAPEIRYHLASALAADGKSAEARSILTTVVNGSRDFEGKTEARRLLESL